MRQAAQCGTCNGATCTQDLELKQNLEMMLERIKENDAGVQSNALQAISQEIRSATTSMTSVPKPLKFLRKHYASIKEFYEGMPASENRAKLADVLSILAISSASQESRESLKFRLAGSKARLLLLKLLPEPQRQACQSHQKCAQAGQRALDPGHLQRVAGVAREPQVPPGWLQGAFGRLQLKQQCTGWPELQRAQSGRDG